MGNERGGSERGGGSRCRGSKESAKTVDFVIILIEMSV